MALTRLKDDSDDEELVNQEGCSLTEVFVSIELTRNASVSRMSSRVLASIGDRLIIMTWIGEVVVYCS